MKYKCKCGTNIGGCQQIVGGTGRTRHLMNHHNKRTVDPGDLRRYFEMVHN